MLFKQLADCQHMTERFTEKKQQQTTTQLQPSLTHMMDEIFLQNDQDQ